jgi:dienelactone hydrolase
MYSLHNPVMSATVVFYGAPETDPAKLKALRGPTLGIFGGADTTIPLDQVEAFRKGLTEAGIRNTVSVYDGEPHAFVHDAAGIAAGGAQGKAWTQMTDFLKDNLQGTRASAPDPDGATSSTSPTPLSYLFALAYEHSFGMGGHGHGHG